MSIAIHDSNSNISETIKHNSNNDNLKIYPTKIQDHCKDIHHD